MEEELVGPCQEADASDVSEQVGVPCCPAAGQPGSVPEALLHLEMETDVCQEVGFPAPGWGPPARCLGPCSAGHRSGSTCRASDPCGCKGTTGGFGAGAEWDRVLRDTCGVILSHKVKNHVAKSRFKKLGNFSSAIGVNGCLWGTGDSYCYGAGEASKCVLCLKVNSRCAPQGYSFNCKYTLYVSVYILFIS